MSSSVTGLSNHPATTLKLGRLVEWIDKRADVLILAVVGLIFLVRAGYFFVQVYPVDQIERPDGYWTIAENLLNGRGYRYDAYMADTNVLTAKRGPTTVLFLWLSFSIFGINFWPVLIAQWAFDAAVGWLIYRIARSIFPHGNYVGILAALMYAVYPYEWKYTAMALGEPLFAFLLAGCVLSLLKALEKPSLARFALSGFLLGLAYHSRPTLLAFPLVVLFLLFFKLKRDRSIVIRSFAAYLAAFVLMLLPWVVRNYLVFHAFVPGTTLLGYNVYHDFLGHLEAQNLIRDEEGRLLVDEELLPHLRVPDYRLGKSEAELDKLWLGMGWELIKVSPGEYIKWSFNNLSRLWLNLGRPRWHDLNPSGFSYVTVLNGTILLLSLAAYVFYRGSWMKSSLPVLLLIVYLTALHTFAYGYIRYSIPMIPYVLMLSAHTLLEWIKSASRRLWAPVRRFAGVPSSSRMHSWANNKPRRVDR